MTFDSCVAKWLDYFSVLAICNKENLPKHIKYLQNNK